MTYALSVSIDGHPLNVVALDGRPIVTQTVDTAAVSPGERLDFWIEAKDPEGLGNYWLRLETLEKVTANEETGTLTVSIFQNIRKTFVN